MLELVFGVSADMGLFSDFRAVFAFVLFLLSFACSPFYLAVLCSVLGAVLLLLHLVRVEFLAG